MKHAQITSWLSYAIAVLALLAAGTGILSVDGPGPSELTTVRGDFVTLHGWGVYKHMSAEVAPQGIAQDYVTAFVAVPLLLISLSMARKGSLRGRLSLAGTLGYFLVTYLFYLMMGMYNVLFIVYVLLLSMSFYATALVLTSFDVSQLPGAFAETAPFRFAGRFLIFNAAAIASLWLSIVIPPLFDGTVIPAAVEHYTTLVVQGLDLALLLPGAFIAGVLVLKRRPVGVLSATVYLVFLSILMTALTAKVIAMGFLGYDILPAAVIIPGFAIVSFLTVGRILRACARA